MALPSVFSILSPSLRSGLKIRSGIIPTIVQRRMLHRSKLSLTSQLSTNLRTNCTPWHHSINVQYTLQQQPLHRLFTTSTVGKGPTNNLEEEKLEKPVGKLREAWNKYGFIAIGTYGGVYVSTLGLLYGLLAADIVGAGGTIQLLKSLHVDSIVDIELINPKAGDLAVAWILTKFTEPLRLLLSLSITPTVARALNPLTGNVAVAEDIEERKQAAAESK